jgi:DNA-binding NtrC family response regulator
VIPRAPKTVLVLEDDESSRFVLRAVMESGGYRVLESDHPKTALDICRVHPETIAVMISDVTAGDATGPNTVRQLKELQPGMAILFVSGYPFEHLKDVGLLEWHDVMDQRMGFLQKPFTPQKLLRVVRELIDDH